MASLITFPFLLAVLFFLVFPIIDGFIAFFRYWWGQCLELLERLEVPTQLPLSARHFSYSLFLLLCSSRFALFWSFTLSHTQEAVNIGIKAMYGLEKRVEAVGNVRKLTKLDMRWNDALPLIEVDPETYTVKADGEVLTCQPATSVPLSRNYFLF